MSKRNSDGNVLENQLRLGHAKHNKFLASWMSTQPEEPTTNDAPKIVEKDTELKKDIVEPDRLGFGHALPKDVADGSFKRTLSSNDKLMEQLLGKKKAKAHLAAKQHAERSGAQTQPKNSRREATKKEESEDDEEGRAAAFTSKRRRVTQSKPVPVSDEEEAGGEEAGVPVTEKPAQEDQEQEQEQQDAAAVQAPQDDKDDADSTPALPKARAIPSRGRAKKTSYLDELLAERSKKKKNKFKNQTAADS